MKKCKDNIRVYGAKGGILLSRRSRMLPVLLRRFPYENLSRV